MTVTSPAGAFHRANSLTYVSLLSGIMAIAAAGADRSGLAGALVALAVIADTFDGRFARRFVRSPAEREIGAHLDSLSDAIAFGIAPCICLARLAAGDAGPLGVVGWWMATFVFAACAITRLAFYNVSQDTIRGFIGIPVPVAALITSSVLLAGPSSATAAIAMVVAGAAMVMPVPIPRPTGYGLALFVLWPVTLVALHLA